MIEFFDANDIAYAVIGAVGLGMQGVVRATHDLDFLMKKEDMPAVSAFLEGLGYSVFNETENVTQFEHSIPAMGVIDCLHAFRKPAMVIIERAVKKPAFSGELQVRVALPEDLIGMMLQAIRNDPMNKPLRMSDIRGLVSLYGNTLDWSAIDDYVSILDMEEVIDEIRSYLA